MPDPTATAHRRRRFLPPLLLLVLMITGACGGDDVDSGATGRAPHVTLAEAQTFLERGRVALAREALDGKASIASELKPQPASSRMLETQRGEQFALAVFDTPAQARAAWDSVLETELVEEGGTAIRALNVVVAFPRPAEDGAYRHVKRRMRELATSCGDPGSADLRQICDTAGGKPVAGSGAGTDRDELAPIGATLAVGGVTYRVTTARQLNPRIAPDEELVGDLRPRGDGVLFGVFLRACNEGDRATRTTDRIALVSAFGHGTPPVALPADNPFTYDAGRLASGSCIPRSGSVADRAVDGALLVFRISVEQLADRPLGLRITSRDGSEQATVRLDV